MWLGLLFSILSITMSSYGRFNDEPPQYEGISQLLADSYRLRTAQCLVMADITRWRPYTYTLETLLYSALIDQLSKNDGMAGVWVMNGSILRVALQMGYHRCVFLVSTAWICLTHSEEIPRRLRTSPSSTVKCVAACGMRS
jgi:hypothetical protein